jgi:hypothetical protein
LPTFQAAIAPEGAPAILPLASVYEQQLAYFMDGLWG